MGVLRHKIWSDLWANKGRTLQVVLIIAMGTAAIGMIIGIRSLVIPTMAVRWQAINPAMINLVAVDPTHPDPAASGWSDLASSQLFGCEEDQVGCFLGSGGSQHRETEDQGH